MECGFFPAGRTKNRISPFWYWAPDFLNKSQPYKGFSLPVCVQKKARRRMPPCLLVYKNSFRISVNTEKPD